MPTTRPGLNLISDVAYQTDEESDVYSRPLMVIAVHPYDGARSCGELVAGHPNATVVTVCGARDRRLDRREEEGLRTEDELAMRVLDAAAVRLPFADTGHATDASPGELADCIEALVQELRAGTIVIPLGWTDTHAAVTRSLLRLAADDTRHRWWCYDDHCFAPRTERAVPLVVEMERADLVSRLVVAPWWRGSRRYKEEALRQYRRLPVGGVVDDNVEIDLTSRERYWELPFVCAPPLLG
jgi:hypothetical protein